ncbi:hypothetical protein ACO1O0_008377 [Amphichorda felina]
MKFQLAILLGLSAITALASPTLERRQNNIPECEKGIEGPENDRFEGPDGEDNCKKKCFFREDAKIDNKGNICAGFCTGPEGITRPGQVQLPGASCHGSI